jgi:hypothetical protein
MGCHFRYFWPSRAHGLPPWALALFHPQYYLECIYNCVWHPQCLFTVCIWVYIITSKCISLVPALVHFHYATAMTTLSNDASYAIGCICLNIRLCLRWPRSSLEPVSFLVSASPPAMYCTSLTFWWAFLSQWCHFPLLMSLFNSSMGKYLACKGSGKSKTHP